MQATSLEGRGEFRSTATALDGLIRGEVLKPTAVRFSDLGGVALFEGDILLGPSRGLQNAFQRKEPFAMGGMGIAIPGATYRWPKRVVPFQIDPALEDPERVREAIAHWQARTPLVFRERTGANATAIKDFVSFERGEGCSSWVGRQGGRQEITLSPLCAVGNVIHEIGHAVGLWHEQSRENRDEYVDVRIENVIAGTEHNFDQHVTDGDDIGDYDFASIMHYPRDAFTRNGKDTIVPKGGQQIGQRLGLSPGDVAAVQALYPG